MKRKPVTILPIAAVLIVAPFFANYREEPLRFGLLQGVLMVFISVAAAGGFKPWRERMRKPLFALFWALLVAAGIAAPFVIK